MTIEKIDFNYGGTPHCLTFHWVVDGGKVHNSNNHYTHCPGEGMLALEYD